MNTQENITPPGEEQLKEEEDLKAMGMETEEKPEPTAEGTLSPEETREKDLAELKDRHLRLVAEFDNFRKRTLKERIELISTAHQDLMTAMLPVLDDFERAAKSMETATGVEAVKEGMDLIYQKLKGILSQKGLKAMESLGQPFNADMHEAITNLPAPGPEQKDTVIDEVEKGYLLGEKVIRYAKVVVGQ